MTEKDKMKIDLEKIKKRKDFTMYSNVSHVTQSEIDVYIDFMQFPPENDEVPSARIYMSHVHAKQFLDVLQGILSQTKSETKKK